MSEDFFGHNDNEDNFDGEFASVIEIQNNLEVEGNHEDSDDDDKREERSDVSNETNFFVAPDETK